MVSQAQMRAVKKYCQKAYDEVSVRFKKGERDEVKVFAYSNGYDSINRFIVEAVKEKMEREKKA